MLVEKPPGTEPPMSSWWAFSVTNATIRVLVEDRPDEQQVVDVRARPVRVVGDDHVARLEAVGPYSSIVMRTESVIVPVNRMMLFYTAGVG